MRCRASEQVTASRPWSGLLSRSTEGRQWVMHRVGHKIATMLFTAAMGLAEVAAGSAAAAATGQYSLRAAIHVHSTMSTGSLDLESLARRAEEQQLDVLILTENYSLRYDYGLQPLEGF